MVIDPKDTGQIEEWINAQRLGVLKGAKRMMDTFWEYRNDLIGEKMSNANKATVETPKLGCMVRETKEGSIRIYWYRFYFTNKTVKRNGASRIVKSRNNIYLKRPLKGYRYNTSVLKKYALPAEHQMVDYDEDYFEECRMKLEALRKLNHDLRIWKDANNIHAKRNKKAPQKNRGETNNENDDRSEKSEPVNFDNFGEDDDD